MNKMHKLDSFIRETLQVDVQPIRQLALMRKASRLLIDVLMPPMKWGNLVSPYVLSRFPTA
jgi:hypothetical protein